MNKVRLFIGVFALLAIVSVSIANSGHAQRSSRSKHMQQAHLIVTPDQVKWGPGPPALPPGAELAVIEGDPSKAGASFTIRAKLPDGYKIPPHWHPTDERVTVLQGSFGRGVGGKCDAAAGRRCPQDRMHQCPWASDRMPGLLAKPSFRYRGLVHSR